MKKLIKTIDFEYHFIPEHKGAPFTFDCIHYMNAGDFKETAFKKVFGYGDRKDANTPFDKGSDIPELNASIKSGKATLTSVNLGNNFDEVKHNYFERVHSIAWIYVTIIDNSLVAYIMNKTEFSSFMDTFGNYCNDRHVIRFKADSGKMIKWFEDRL